MNRDAITIERTLVVSSARRPMNEAVRIVNKFLTGYVQVMEHPLAARLERELATRAFQDMLYYLFSRHAFDDNGFIQMKTSEASIILRILTDPDDDEDYSVSALPFAGMQAQQAPVELIINRNPRVVVEQGQIAALAEMGNRGVLLVEDVQLPRPISTIFSDL